MTHITSDFILNLIFSVMLFGGMNEFERSENRKYTCPRYCAIEHKHNLGLAPEIQPIVRFEIKSPIYIEVTAEKKP